MTTIDDKLNYLVENSGSGGTSDSVIYLHNLLISDFKDTTKFSVSSNNLVFTGCHNSGPGKCTLLNPIKFKNSCYFYILEWSSDGSGVGNQYFYVDVSTDGGQNFAQIKQSAADRGTTTSRSYSIFDFTINDLKEKDIFIRLRYQPSHNNYGTDGSIFRGFIIYN